MTEVTTTYHRSFSILGVGGLGPKSDNLHLGDVPWIPLVVTEDPSKKVSSVVRGGCLTRNPGDSVIC